MDHYSRTGDPSVLLQGPQEMLAHLSSLRLWHMWLHAFLCEQGKNRDAPLLAETLQTRCTHVKRDRFLKSPRHGQHPERDRNEILRPSIDRIFLI